MSRRLHNFPQSFKGVAQFNRFIDFTSAGLIGVGLGVWFLLSKTIGVYIPIAVNVIGFSLTLSLYLLYTVKIPVEYYNKLGGERVYKLLYATIVHSRKNIIHVKSTGGEKQ
jgi:hypothetical protein